MGNKIFVSYKYWDSDVKAVPKFTKDTPKVRDYVSWLEDKFTNRTEHYYKGESDNDDLSKYSEAYIYGKLKDKIFDSSLTIVLISPNMKDYHKYQKSQWIPWEISYSIRKTPRSSYTSQRNAILAVILPNKHNSYDYYSESSLFPILKDNIDNGYIPVVKWDEFKYNCDEYIKDAYQCQKATPEYKLHINL